MRLSGPGTGYAQNRLDSFAQPVTSLVLIHVILMEDLHHQRRQIQLNSKQTNLCETLLRHCLILNLFIMDLMFDGPIKVHLACVLLHVALILGKLPMELIQIMNCAGILFFNLKASFNIVMQKAEIIIKQPPFILEDCTDHQEKKSNAN